MNAAMLPLAMLFALAVDRLFGEPPAWLHPVVGMGRYLGTVGRHLHALSPAAAFIGGALVWLLGAALVGGLALALQWVLPALLLGLALKPLLAWRMLRDEVQAVEAALQQSVELGRQRLSRLVSRDTTALDATEVREAAIETLAENLNDSVVAPLFWFALLGLPGAAVYRFANTADAMWGYRDHREWSGKWAARADDVLSWIPARITAVAMIGWRRGLAREATRTPSPNSGWPMAAMALRLGLKLGKPGIYNLNATGRAPRADDIADAIACTTQALIVSTIALALLAVGVHR
ncbi:adenosylcobinamide-phosphate synthase CbiB [Paucibacter sp. R3-3]|uniref:Cobalamin biosynthesis protein CobD n=1 Tax=Roseateles agri TaxID=3098619 RepID=A0ABU5DNL4_9BURK|nr:adenosylcobinamide-phosphate synthase CbiB [Paucibacter sp. R3-3]MDY0747904.1 adenosylcobinamide-phosphate synthase CbiB [Paucibacter sp. R3-3]